jgi:hypothetical protein
VARELHPPTHEMTTTATTMFRGLFKTTLACTRCGSDDAFPAPGPFGALASLVGLERHLCRPCGRPFWAKTSAEYTPTETPGEPEGESLGAFLDTTTEGEDGEDSLDLDMSGPEPEPVDLAALDAEFERRCAEYGKASRKASRKARRKETREPSADQAPVAEAELAAAER